MARDLSSAALSQSSEGTGADAKGTMGLRRSSGSARCLYSCSSFSGSPSMAASLSLLRKTGRCRSAVGFLPMGKSVSASSLSVTLPFSMYCM